MIFPAALTSVHPVFSVVQEARSPTAAQTPRTTAARTSSRTNPITTDDAVSSFFTRSGEVDSIVSTGYYIPWHYLNRSSGSADGDTMWKENALYL